MKILVGLGNPGQKFENTRHNVGFLVLDELKSQVQSLKFKINKKFQAEILQLTTNSLQLILVKPQTFMNESGKAIKKIINYYQKPPHYSLLIANYLYVIHDDLDIPLGEYKIQFGKGPKVHNGILSIEKELKTKDFWRVRVGIENRVLGNKSFRVLGENYVLEKFSKKEKEILDGTIKKIVDDFLVILSPDVRSGRRT